MTEEIGAVASIFKQSLGLLGVEYSRLFLFGSRANDRASEESDWDFVVVLKQKMSDKNKRATRAQLRILFHEHFPKVGIDIILKEEELFEQERNQVNTLAYEVACHGVQL